MRLRKVINKETYLVIVLITTMLFWALLSLVVHVKSIHDLHHFTTEGQSVTGALA